MTQTDFNRTSIPGNSCHNCDFHSHLHDRDALNDSRNVGSTWQYHNVAQVPPTGFEGPEKKLEIDFKMNNPNGNPLGFRVITRDEWQRAVLDRTRCSIISHQANEHFDAYVLSESTLIVYPTKVMIKTCGMIMLLHAIRPLLQIAHRLDMNVEFVFYSRKNFIFPALQPSPHRSFEEEMSMLEQYFDGSGHVIGSLNRDHWYLYLADYTDSAAPVTNSIQTATNGTANDQPTVSIIDQPRRNKPDQTLEIMMHDLNPLKMKQFFKTDDFVSVEHVTETSGIGHILPGSKIDAFMFDPCGYSMNGLLGDAYWTIHVTPEDEFSFVSFETNISRDNLPPGGFSQLIERVIDVFEPGRFTVAFFADDHALPNKSYCEMSFKSRYYVRNQHSGMDFCNDYNLSVCHWLHKDHPLVKKSMKRVFSMEDALQQCLDNDDSECMSESSVEEITNE